MPEMKEMDIVEYVGESTPTYQHGTPFLVQSINRNGVDLARLYWHMVSQSPHEIQYAVDHKIINITVSQAFFETYFRFHSHYKGG